MIEEAPSALPDRREESGPSAASLERDKYRAEALRKVGRSSPTYVSYALNLRHYAFNTLMSQWREKQLLSITFKKTGIRLPPPPDEWGLGHFRSIVGAVVSTSVEPFLESAIFRKGWDAARGATIPTYFVGWCYYAFADEYRREYQAESRSLQDVEAANRSHFDLELDVVRYAQACSPDPERTIINRAEIRRLLKLTSHARIPEIVFLLAEGFTCREVGHRLGMSENAVNKAIGKFRSDVSLSRNAG